MIFTSKNSKSKSKLFNPSIFIFFKIKYSIFLIIGATLVLACENKIQYPNEEKPKITDELKSVTYKQMTAKMPIHYPEELLNFNYIDFKRIALDEQSPSNANFRTE